MCSSAEARKSGVCGIVGLFLKDPALEPELGRLTEAMLAVLSDRGPDSAGFAVYGHAEPGTAKLTLRGPAGWDARAVALRLAEAIGAAPDVQVRGDHAVLRVPTSLEELARQKLAAVAPDVRIVGSGARMELFKGVGLPPAVTARFGLGAMAGTHAIGHTRLATESAVTISGAHPFSTGADQCIVHNGSLSNHNDWRRRLVREGMAFATDNDTEVAAGYLSWRLARGERLAAALTAALDDLDGFYTFVVGTGRGFGVLRDPIACKPAVLAETGRYVAFASEYRALVDLPDIETARIVEPEPGRVYVWERPA
jgi:glutamate synthase domain-containing protein 1